MTEPVQRSAIYPLSFIEGMSTEEQYMWMQRGVAAISEALETKPADIAWRFEWGDYSYLRILIGVKK